MMKVATGIGIEVMDSAPWASTHIASLATVIVEPNLLIAEINTEPSEGNISLGGQSAHRAH